MALTAAVAAMVRMVVQILIMRSARSSPIRMIKICTDMGQRGFDMPDVRFRAPAVRVGRAVQVPVILFRELQGERLQFGRIFVSGRFQQVG